MNDDLEVGTPVRTKRPARESSDWAPGFRDNVRWDVDGEVTESSNAHGRIYKVRHADGTSDWYERRELQRMNTDRYSSTERQEFIAKMDLATQAFYRTATSIGVHAFIEFAGLMGEFAKVCAEAERRGIDFTFANTHTGQPLPFAHWNAAYLAEKLNCIYGPSLLADENARQRFIEVLFDGAFRLVPSDPTTARLEEDTD